MKCERCEVEEADIFCLRCKRSICQKCYKRPLGLCFDCVNFKTAREWDRRQLVRTLADTVSIASQKLETDSCLGCGILRYHLLFTLKVLKSLGIELEEEDLSGLKTPVTQLRDT
ncbi:MAG: hypothetical protein ACFFAJ_18810, partial [Candidatus Hodarchaeota archaeon]